MRRASSKAAVFPPVAVVRGSGNFSRTLVFRVRLAVSFSGGVQKNIATCGRGRPGFFRVVRRRSNCVCCGGVAVTVPLFETFLKTCMGNILGTIFLEEHSWKNSLGKICLERHSWENIPGKIFLQKCVKKECNEKTNLN